MSGRTGRSARVCGMLQWRARQVGSAPTACRSRAVTSGWPPSRGSWPDGRAPARRVSINGRRAQQIFPLRPTSSSVTDRPPLDCGLASPPQSPCPVAERSPRRRGPQPCPPCRVDRAVVGERPGGGKRRGRDPHLRQPQTAASNPPHPKDGPTRPESDGRRLGRRVPRDHGVRPAVAVGLASRT